MIKLHYAGQTFELADEETAEGILIRIGQARLKAAEPSQYVAAAIQIALKRGGPVTVLVPDGALLALEQTPP